MPNYAFTRGVALPTINNGHTFEYANFMQRVPNTPIFVGITGLTFRKCNLTNCDVPPDATLINCSHIHKELCANLHPKWVAKGIPAEVENCSHVVDTDTVTIDGVLVDTIYHYEDTIVPPVTMILPKTFLASMFLPFVFMFGKVISENPTISRRKMFNPFLWFNK